MNNKMEIEFIGKVKIVILSGSKALSRNQDEGSIVRGYIECDDVAMSDGKTFRQEIKDNEQIGLRIVLDDAKPLRWPIWVGELSELTQEEVGQ